MSPLVIDIAGASVDGSIIGVSAAAIVALMGWVLARFLVRCVELCHPLAQRGTRQQHKARVTDFDAAGGR